MVAWAKFSATDEFKNALRWAHTLRYEDGRLVDDFMREQYAKGTMWLAFTRGMGLNIEVADKNRGWIVASIGQFKYAQFLLAESGAGSSTQIDEFIKKLEEAIK